MKRHIFGKNVKFYVKFRNLESMTRKVIRKQKFWRMTRHVFWEKSHGKRNFSSESNTFSEIGRDASLSQRGWTPLSTMANRYDVLARRTNCLWTIPLTLFPN